MAYFQWDPNNPQTFDNSYGSPIISAVDCSKVDGADFTMDALGAC